MIIEDEIILLKLSWPISNRPWIIWSDWQKPWTISVRIVIVSPKNELGTFWIQDESITAWANMLGSKVVG
jgi:hypothetical protein